MKRVITFGTFDLFHIGHLNILRRAAKLGEQLIVGVSSDKLTYDKKAKLPVYNEDDRMQIVKAIQYVDEVFLEESLDLKAHYIQQHRADVLVMGDDWEGRFDDMEAYCEVVYLPRTEGISTTELVDSLKHG
jgi:glycerol-3-phosphate cytidylyltransferase